MTLRQFTAALRLGLAYGHEWAVAFSRRGLLAEDTNGLVSWPAGQPIPSVEEIHRQTVEDRGEHSLVGISHPTFLYGRLVHTTDSGRLSWTIQEDGKVRFEINRPQQEWVLIVEVEWRSGGWGEYISPASQPYSQNPQLWVAGSVEIYLNHPEQIYQRHLGAAREAMAALIGQEKAGVVFGPELMAQAKPDEPRPAEAAQECQRAGALVEPEEIPEYTVPPPPNPQWRPADETD